MFNFFKFFKTDLFERETERERESMLETTSGEREKQAGHLVGYPMQGSIPRPWDHDLS